jgi:hypothetical protein
MKVYELAYACRLYREVSQFDPAYRKMRDALGRNPNLASQTTSEALMRFLNDWRCRIPEKNFSSLKERLQHWTSVWIPQLPETGRDVCSLNDHECAQVGVSYEELLRLGTGLHFQDTAAAKTLHALRPEALPMWDNKIKDWFSASSGLAGEPPGHIYSNFVRHVANQISDLEQDVRRLKRSLTDVAQLVQRSGASLVKLVDEYYWITISSSHAVPTRDELEQWLSWIP